MSTHVVTPLTPSIYNMCIKLKEKGLQCPSLPTPCWHIDDKTCPHAGVDIQKPPQLEEKTCPLGTNHNKNLPSHEPQLLPQPHKKEQFVKPNQFKWG